MKRLIYLIVITLLAACQSKKEKVLTEAEAIVKAWAVNDSVVASVDKITIYDLDTLTDLKDSLNKIIRLQGWYDLAISQVKSSNSLAALHLESAKLSKSQARLYREILDSETLAEIEDEDAKSSQAKLNEAIEESKAHIARSEYYDGRIRNIVGMVKNKQLDSVSFRGHIVHFHLLGSDSKGKQVKLDSVFLVLSPEMRIVPQNVQ